MGQDAKKTLNIGSGFNKMVGAINMDISPSCRPEVVWDMTITPWPFGDGEFERVNAYHVLEHVPDFWPCVQECARVLAVGGTLEVHVPHASSDSALTYRDHHRMFGANSFHGIYGPGFGTSAWGYDQRDTVPLRLVAQHLVAFKEYDWVARWFPRVMHFCAKHMRNFVWEHQFIFERV